MSLTATRGVALYVGALLGPGLLVLPGLAAALAGPASILAWAGLLVLSGLVAVVFAALGVTLPAAGGVAGYTRLGLGQRAGAAVGWCFLAGIVTGAPVVCHMGAAYLAGLLGGGRGWAAGAGAVLLLLVLVVTARGVRASAAVQLVLVAVLVAVVLLAVVGALPAADVRHFSPFAPYGWTAVGAAATVLMLSFVGWEAIAPLTGHFADPRRTLPRVIGVAFAVTAVIYLALAAVTVAALGEGSGTEVPMAALLSLSLGGAGPVVAAVSAVVLTVGTANAYLTGGAALARTLTPRRNAGVFPRWLLVAMVGTGLVVLGLIGTGLLPVAEAVAVPSSFFLAVYLGCTASAWRILRGPARAAAAVAGGAVVAVLAFAGPALIPVVAVAAVGLSRRPSPAQTHRDEDGAGHVGARPQQRLPHPPAGGGDHPVGGDDRVPPPPRDGHPHRPQQPPVDLPHHPARTVPPRQQHPPQDATRQGGDAVADEDHRRGDEGDEPAHRDHEQIPHRQLQRAQQEPPPEPQPPCRDDDCPPPQPFPGYGDQIAPQEPAGNGDQVVPQPAARNGDQIVPEERDGYDDQMVAEPRQRPADVPGQDVADGAQRLPGEAERKHEDHGEDPDRPVDPAGRRRFVHGRTR